LESIEKSRNYHFPSTVNIFWVLKYFTQITLNEHFKKSMYCSMLCAKFWHQ
jgi:hypothetical protein